MRHLLFFLFSLFSFSVFAQEENVRVSTRDSFEKLWKTAEEYENDDLPKSAEKVISVILEKAIKENNFQHFAKATMKRTVARKNISTDSILVDLDNMEKSLYGPMVSNGPDAKSKTAVMHALIASVYQNVGYSSLSRSNEELKADVNNKVSLHVQCALEDKNAIANVNANPYKQLFEVGDDSKLFNNDVLSLILLFVDRQNLTAYEQQPKETMVEHLQQAYDIYKGLNMKDATILIQLRIWEIQRSYSRANQRLSYQEYKDKLKDLCEQSVGLEAGADAFLVYYNMKSFNSKKERLELLQWAQKQWGNTKHADYIADLQKQLFDKQVDIYVQGNVVAQQKFKIVLSHQNVNEMLVTVRNNKNNIVLNQTIRHDDEKPQDLKKDTIWTSLPPGKYFVKVEADGKKYENGFQISSLKLLSFRLPEMGTVVSVVNAMSGLPQKQCKVILGYNEWKDGKYVTSDSITLITDDKGQVNIDSEKYSWAYAQLNDDDISNKVSLATRDNNFEPDEKVYTLYRIFTDRAIYRPGQTVLVSGYAYKQRGDEFNVVPNKKVTIKAQDANWNEFYNNKLTTDEFGMVTDSIVIPKNLLNGTFYVSINEESTSFKVEEYKRPTFDIQFEDFDGTMAFGDSVKVVGVVKTYSGVPVQGAKVAVEVENRKVDFWRIWMYGRENWKQVNTIELVTDDDGKFEVDVFLDGDRMEGQSMLDWRETFDGVMQYKVNAKVTDLAGETHEQQTFLNVTEYDFGLSVQGPDNLNVDNPEPFIIKAVNAMGKNMNVKGTWMLQRYQRNSENGRIEKVDMDIKGEFETNKPMDMEVFKNLPLGAYALKVETSDSKQHKYSLSKDFVLFAQKEQPIFVKNDWMFAPYDKITEDKGLDIYYALEEDNPFIYAYIISQNKIEWQKVETVNNNIKFVHIDFKEEYKNGIAVFLTYVKDDEQHQISRSFNYVVPEKKLDIEWKTFRDKLIPGQQETWTLVIKDKDGKPVNAQFLATMYDASLDALQPHGWNFNLPFSRYAPHIYSYSSNSGRSSIYDELNFNSTNPVLKNRKYNLLQGFDAFASYSPMRLRAASSNYMVLEEKAMAMDMDDAMPQEQMNDNENNTENGNEEQQNNVKLRSNFAETAFFYPNLVTDLDGNVNISFTLPETLTEWKFMGFAHTKDLDYGIFTDNAVARKDFMVQPNMPRFIRKGDKAAISARIINQADHDVQGDAIIKMINPIDNSIVYEQKVEFNVETGKTQNVTFNFEAIDDSDMLICEIYAIAGGMSDGERNWLPILESKKLITETVPFFIKANETKEIDISSLFNHGSQTAVDRKLFFEYTDNPSWNVVLAMHAVMNPKDDDAISWSVALYANSALQHLANRVPRLKELIEQWKNENMDEDNTLQSELEKNQQLKDIILQEAPWMMEAQAETVNKKTLVELFDTNLINARLNKAKEKLADLQLAEGAWTWFKGMEPSYYTTFAVCDNLAKLYEYLNHVNEKMDGDVNGMLQRGLSYLDKIELKSYEEYMKKHKKDMLDNTTLHYMYMVAVTQHEMNSKTNSMIKDYLKRLKGKAKDMTTYGKANIAATLIAFGKTKDAMPYVKSLREYTITKPGMGRFFDGENTFYSWCDYRIPSHVAAMKAMLLTKDQFTDAQDYLYDMQIWLVRQKQTQQWNSITNTINAVDLLLTVSPDSAFYMEQMPTVKFGNNEIQLDGQTAGLGFVKTTVMQDVLDETMNSPQPTVTVYKPSPGFSWGTVYGQSVEKLDNMKQNGQELTVERKFYLEQNGEWVPVQDDYVYKVGDKIKIRHIITADRDMDFVQVRAQHAACLEPVKNKSGYQNLGGRGGYLALHDASADFFFSKFIKGTATVDLDMYVTASGSYSNGIVTVQCAYAPDFAGHSSGNRINVR